MSPTKVVELREKLYWKVHTPELFREILTNPQCSLLRLPILLLRNLLVQVGERAIELNDLRLNKLMIRLTLYSIADPMDPAYDYEAVEQVLSQEEI